MEDYNKIRMQCAGAISLLCDLHLTCKDEETKENIVRAVNDWCDVTGWGYKQVLDRIELVPPKN